MARILIVEARFYAHLNDLLLAGARSVIEAAGHDHETITVPGALELPGAIAIADSGGFDAFVALGVVIRGEASEAEPEYAFYNSPVIPGPLRRNEVWLALG